MLCTMCLSMFLSPEQGEHHKDFDSVEKASDNGCYICHYLFYHFQDQYMQDDFPIKYVWHQNHPTLFVSRALNIDFEPEEECHDIQGYYRCLENVKTDLEKGDFSRVHETKLRPPEELSNTGDDEALRFFRERLQDCKTSHEECRIAALTLSEAERTDSSAWSPRRLIDCSVDDGMLHLVHGTDLTNPVYATLSYCWGKEKFFMLQSGNERDALDSKIPLSELPLLFRQSIALCRNLGIQYFWIDSVCIIQSGDNQQDWLLHAREMSTIYAFCAFSISAEYARNPHQSLFVDRFLEPPIIMPPSDNSWAAVRETWENSGDERYKTDVHGELDNPFILGQPYRLSYMPDYLERSAVLHTPLSTRGWVLQERLLAPRTLHFAQHRVSWSCYSHNVNEDDSTELEEHEYRWFKRLEPNMIKENPDLAEFARYYPLEWWFDTVADYSKRQLSFPEKDKLVAIAGIARVWNHERQFDYLAGIFRPHLPWALLWHRDPDAVDPIHAKQPLGDDSFTPGGVPSWSWATCKFPVKSYPYTVTEFLVNGTVLVDIKCAEVELADKENPYGQVKSGKIELKGYLGCKKDFDDNWNYCAYYDGRFKEDEEAPWHLPITWNHMAKQPDLFGLLLREYEGSRLFYQVGYFIVSITAVAQDVL
ncbi:heterokaryon incompatibility protein [Fusarium pseudoanthophilum]|uniref:Heterokaryon incompatibility protein n=1 Tax=Fusarium pseudoanthophilum TaxID=48495 RepID=A0A8H5UV89_9HYPO|nr:heterokaryon incompatibility protein [Fusarium pseudoanthophilum]